MKERELQVFGIVIFYAETFDKYVSFKYFNFAV